MIKINLLPVRSLKRKESIRQQVSIAILTALLLFVVIGYLHISLSGQISSVQEEIANTNDEIEKFKKVIREIKVFKEKKKILTEKIKIIEKLEENRRGPLKLFEEISNIIPERVWLESLREKGSFVEIKGVASDNKIIADFMSSIEGSSVFHGVELKISKLSNKYKQGFKNFTINFKLIR